MWPEILPTVIICLILAAAVGLAIYSIIRDKKKGKSCSCGCSCSSCAMSGACHIPKNTDNKNNTPDAEDKPHTSEETSEN